MSSPDEPYPESCAFCRIAAAYPAGAHAVPSDPDPDKTTPQCHLILSTPHVLAFLDIMPISPGHLLLITREHHPKLSALHPQPPPSPTPNQDWLTLRRTTSLATTARELGRWLPILSAALCRVTGVEDWNVVQNNGARAAQVVPHIHFHLIPRYQEGRRETERKGHVDVGMLRSWRMFGRGTREDLDDEEGAEIAARLRRAVRVEVGEEAASKL